MESCLYLFALLIACRIKITNFTLLRLDFWVGFLLSDSLSEQRLLIWIPLLGLVLIENSLKARLLGEDPLLVDSLDQINLFVGLRNHWQCFGGVDFIEDFPPRFRWNKVVVDLRHIAVPSLFRLDHTGASLLRMLPAESFNQNLSLSVKRARIFWH